MKIAFVGDIHGLLDLAYLKLGEYDFDLALLVGDTELTKNPANVRNSRIPKFPDELQKYATFERYLSGDLKIPYPTAFIRGNHEDFKYLRDVAAGRESLPENLFYLPDGFHKLCGLNIGVVGGSHNWRAYKQPELKKKYEHNFSHREVDALKAKDLDIVLTHNGAETRLLTAFGGRGSPQLTDLIHATHPRLALHGHHDLGYETYFGETRIIGLRDIHQPDSIFVYDTETGEELKAA